MMIRQPVVAGTFYNDDAEELKNYVLTCLTDQHQENQKAIAAMVPHAGYVYSGKITAQTIAQLPQSSTIIILGPNHTGLGSMIAVSDADEWQTPLGNLKVNKKIAETIVEQSVEAEFDNAAHQSEHSIEVILPFIQVRSLTSTIVPITVGLWAKRSLMQLGETIAMIIKESKEPIHIIASSDMNHFEDLKTTKRLDQLAIEQVEKKDPDGLLATVAKHDISMCGVAPTAVMLYAMNKLGNTNVKIVQYGTSADAFGDKDRVVGYAGVILEKLN